MAKDEDYLGDVKCLRIDPVHSVLPEKVVTLTLGNSEINFGGNLVLRVADTLAARFEPGKWYELHLVEKTAANPVGRRKNG